MLNRYISIFLSSILILLNISCGPKDYIGSKDNITDCYLGNESVPCGLAQDVLTYNASISNNKFLNRKSLDKNSFIEDVILPGEQKEYTSKKTSESNSLLSVYTFNNKVSNLDISTSDKINNFKTKSSNEIWEKVNFDVKLSTNKIPIYEQSDSTCCSPDISITNNSSEKIENLFIQYWIEQDTKKFAAGGSVIVHENSDYSNYDSGIISPYSTIKLSKPHTHFVSLANGTHVGSARLIVELNKRDSSNNSTLNLIAVKIFDVELYDKNSNLSKPQPALKSDELNSINSNIVNDPKVQLKNTENVKYIEIPRSDIKNLEQNYITTLKNNSKESIQFSIGSHPVSKKLLISQKNKLKYKTLAENSYFKEIQVNTKNPEMKFTNYDIGNDIAFFRFTKKAGKRYSIFARTTSGDVSIFSHYDKDKLYDFEYLYSSENPGTELDVIHFDAKYTGDFYFLIYPEISDSSFVLKIEELDTPLPDSEYINGFVVKGAILKKKRALGYDVGSPISEQVEELSYEGDVQTQYFSKGAFIKYNNEAYFVSNRFLKAINRINDLFDIELGKPISNIVDFNSEKQMIQFEGGYVVVPKSSDGFQFDLYFSSPSLQGSSDLGFQLSSAIKQTGKGSTLENLSEAVYANPSNYTITINGIEYNNSIEFRMNVAFNIYNFFIGDDLNSVVYSESYGEKLYGGFSLLLNVIPEEKLAKIASESKKVLVVGTSSLKITSKLKNPTSVLQKAISNSLTHPQRLFKKINEFKGWHTHHIIPRVDLRAEALKSKIEKLGINVEDALNGVNVHPKVHFQTYKDDYFEFLNSKFVGVNTKKQAEERLNSLINRFINENETFKKFEASGNNVQNYTINW